MIYTISVRVELITGVTTIYAIEFYINPYNTDKQIYTDVYQSIYNLHEDVGTIRWMELA